MPATTPHVLLVEDDPDFAYLNRCRLANHEVSTEVCPTLSDALSRIDSASGRAFDAILLDLRLPDVDGLEGVTALRAATDLPIVVMTALADHDLAAEAVRLGADDYLDKAQADARRMVDSIRFAIERRGGAADDHDHKGEGLVSLVEDVLDELARFLHLETMAFHQPDGMGTVWVHRHPDSPWLAPRELLRYIEVVVEGVTASVAPQVAGDAQRRLSGIPRLGSYVALPLDGGRGRRPLAFLCGLSPDLTEGTLLVDRYPAARITARLLSEVIGLDRQVANETRRRMVAEGMRTGGLAPPA